MSANSKAFLDAIEEARKSDAYEIEGQFLEITEAICAAMERKGVSRSQLAKRMKVTPSRITKVLSGQDNLTIATLAKIGVALGERLQVLLCEADAGSCSSSAFGDYLPGAKDFKSVRLARIEDLINDPLGAAAA